jgi:dimethylhistidine N-methyltransferase
MSTDSGTRIHPPGERRAATDLANLVHYYLTLNPRQLPSRYLYDSLGSTLFDAICLLPWYRITRAEADLLALHGREVFARLGRVSTLVELGSGSGEKLRMLVQRRSPHLGQLEVHLIDVSRAALQSSTRALVDIEGVTAVAHEAEYEDGLAAFARVPHSIGATLTLFLGSNVGNFDRPGAEAMLRRIRAALAAGDGLLVGADLLKPEPDLLLAYDDPLGVTAAFNRNLLVRINRELGGNFDLVGFGHRAIWNARDSRVEMHLVAHGRQRVRINALDLDIELADGETIWTESSYKYRPAEIVSLVECTGFRLAGQWLADADQFALTLFEAA